jgi:hypothetical protein
MGSADNGFKPGRKKPEGSGRQKGTLNKKSQVLMEIFEAADYCPAVELLKIVKGEKTGERILLLEDKEIADIHMKLMEYKFPKRKAVEHSGTVTNELKRYEDYLQEIENGQEKTN